MKTPKNRIVIHRMDSTRKTIHDYGCRRDAMVAFYSICDAKGYNYGHPIYERVGGVKTQVAQQSGGIGHEYKIVLYV